MNEFLIGCGIGLGLTVMAGPITLTIIESSLEGGRISGLVSALGMWMSDLLFITITLLGGKVLASTLSEHQSDKWIYIVGGLILIGFGAGFWINRHKPVDISNPARTVPRLANHFGRGFMINTLSPFTLVFWPSIALTLVFSQDLSSWRTFFLYFGIMLLLVVGDSLKAFLAAWMRISLSSNKLYLVRSGIAILFGILGLVMISRIFFLETT